MYPDYSNPRARAVGRSYYSMVAAFPTSCFVLTLLTDLAYWKTKSVLWETFSVWLLALGLLGAGLALVAGLVDIVRSRTVRGLGQPWPRLFGHLVAVALSFVNVLVHSRDGYTAVVPQGVILSAIVVLVLLATVVADRSATRNQRAGAIA